MRNVYFCKHQFYLLQIKGDFSEKSSRIYSELENYKVVVDELDKKVEKLKVGFK